MKHLLNSVSMLVAAALLAAPWQSSSGAEESPAKKIQKAKIIFLGDSLTSNNGSLGPARGYDHWTDVVKTRFELDVVNLGKGGSRADAGLDRLKKALAEGAKPDFVLINFGMNDHKIAMKTREPVSSTAAFEQQLTDIVKTVRAAGAEPVLVTPHAIYEGVKGDAKSYYGKYDPELFESEGGALKRFDTFMAVIRKVAADQRVGLIDIRKESDKYKASEYTIEGVHLSQLGHKIYGDLIIAYLAENY